MIFRAQVIFHGKMSHISWRHSTFLKSLRRSDEAGRYHDVKTMAKWPKGIRVPWSLFYLTLINRRPCRWGALALCRGLSSLLLEKEVWGLIPSLAVTFSETGYLLSCCNMAAIWLKRRKSSKQPTISWIRIYRIYSMKFKNESCTILQQLDPTIQGTEAAHSQGLEQTIFDRLLRMVRTCYEVRDKVKLNSSGAKSLYSVSVAQTDESTGLHKDKRHWSIADYSLVMLEPIHSSLKWSSCSWDKSVLPKDTPNDAGSNSWPCVYEASTLTIATAGMTKSENLNS